MCNFKTNFIGSVSNNSNACLVFFITYFHHPTGPFLFCKRVTLHILMSIKLYPLYQSESIFFLGNFLGFCYFIFLFVCFILSFIIEAFLKYVLDLVVCLHLRYVSEEMKESSFVARLGVMSIAITWSCGDQLFSFKEN